MSLPARLCIIVAILVAPCTLRPAGAKPPSVGPPVSEYEIKAAALYNVIAFTKWPADAFSGPHAPLTIGVLGHGPIAALIDEVVAGATWEARKVVVAHYDSVDQIGPCQLLFVARSERNRWDDVRARFGNRPVLAVSDTDNFAVDGGNIQFEIVHDKLRILVNLASTRASGIELSSNLLRLATIVGPQSGPMPSPPSSRSVAPLSDLSLCLAVVFAGK
ncbi:MAG TPA: YfiR family protein [Opitutaceae bacterium]|nr:YfiR family protein [Opitutaceae bacterium]